MLKILPSKDTLPSKTFTGSTRKKNEDNAAWVKRHLKTPPAQALVVLLGGVDPLAFRLRAAQSHMRHDLTPSSWSHAVLMPSARELDAGWEISLDPAGGFGFPPAANGLQQCDTDSWADPRRFPNVAALLLPAPSTEVDRALKAFQKQRAALDAVELLVTWLAFAWGAARTPNPLLDGNGMPSAAMIESVLGATGFELTPNLPSRSSCPEAIWQAARWWSGFYRAVKRKDEPRGWWHREHALVPE